MDAIANKARELYKDPKIKKIVISTINTPFILYAVISLTVNAFTTTKNGWFYDALPIDVITLIISTFSLISAWKEWYCWLILILVGNMLFGLIVFITFVFSFTSSNFFEDDGYNEWSLWILVLILLLEVVYVVVLYLLIRQIRQEPNTVNRDNAGFALIKRCNFKIIHKLTTHPTPHEERLQERNNEQDSNV